MGNFSNFTTPPFLIKVLELILGAVCVGLIAGTLWISTTKVEVIHATFFGFFMVSAVTVISYILDAPIKGMLMMVISFCAGVMYFTSGALAIQIYDQSTRQGGQLLGAGIVGLITGITYFVDCFLSWRNK